MKGMVGLSMQISDHSKQSAPGKLGFWMCLALVMGTMIGSGVFLLPASLAPLGWNAVIGWIVTIFGTLCMVLVFARLARDMPGGSGPYAYAAAAFGPGAGFIVAWSFWIGVWVTVAALAVAVASNLSSLFPIIAADPRVSASVALGVIWLLTALNCLGVREAGKVQLLTMILKIIPLAGAVMLAAWLLGSGEVTPPPLAEVAPISLSGISSAAALTLFAFLGFESALAVGDRVERPEVNVPRATLIGAIATGIIYLFACSAVTMLMPVADVARSNAPFATFFTAFISPAAGQAVALFAAIAALGSLNGNVLQQGEVLTPLAHSGMLPAWFALQSSRGTPVRVHLLSSSLASLLVLANFTKGIAGLFKFMALVTTSVTIIFYMAGVLAALKFERSGRIGTSRGFAALTIISLVYAAWAFYGAGLEASLWSLLMTATGIPIYLFMTKSRAAQQPAE